MLPIIDNAGYSMCESTRMKFFTCNKIKNEGRSSMENNKLMPNIVKYEGEVLQWKIQRACFSFAGNAKIFICK